MLRIRLQRASSLPLPLLRSSPLAASTSKRFYVEIATPSATTTQPKFLRRFWKTVGLRKDKDSFAVTLDGRAIKTPNGAVLEIPASHKPLAVLVAAEWESQDKASKNHSGLPLTSLVARAIDGLADHVARTQVISSLIVYLHTDTACYHHEYPDKLVDAQRDHWLPLIEWAQTTFKVPIHTTTGIVAPKQSPETVEAFRKVLEDMDNLSLAAFERAVHTSKSFLISMALMSRQISVPQAVQASRLEVLHQIDRWGEVEDSHDVDDMNVTRMLASCCLVGCELAI